MQSANLQLIIVLASIIGTVLVAFGFLHREMRNGFERVDQRFRDVDQRFRDVDQKFDRMEAKADEKFAQMDKKFDGLQADVGALRVSVARIEGHLGLVVPAPTAPRPGSEPPERAA